MAVCRLSSGDSMKTSVFAIICLGFASPVLADESVDYLRRIKPLLQARCYACHGVLKQEGGLRLDTVALAVKGSDAGIVLKPGDIEAGSLLRRVASKDDADRMPPEGEPLKGEEIAALRGWIAQGAVAPADEKPERDPRDHWAFQRPVRPEIPQVAPGSMDAAHARRRALLVRQGITNGPAVNPIDALIDAGHQEHGLLPQAAADRHVWLRRVSLDLIGLPPTKAELDAFLADQSADAVDQVVTRLLESPHYGERWGRHWMDIWRYSDWWGLGEEVRNSQKHIWHWRDWIIESLNADKGYDQMLREMLAADELYPDDADRLRAGGFLARQYFKFNRTSWLDESVEHTAKAMIGLTFNCAKCHDHKYDPFSQADYYRFRAVFEPYQVRIDAVPGEPDFEKDGLPRGFDCNLDVKTWLHIRGDDRNPDTTRVMEPAFPAFLFHGDAKIEPVSLPAEAIQPGLRPFVVEAFLTQAEQRIAARRVEVDAAKQRLIDAERLEQAGLAMSPADKMRNTGRTLVRDDFSMARPEVWETRDGAWTFAEGKLLQSQDGAVRTALRLKQLPPQDFEAKLKYVATGGQVWKSVGLTFDVTPANEMLAYCSACAAGPKVQFAYKPSNQTSYVYPGEAAQVRKIELGQPYELTLRVRGTLVNLSVNGEHVVAYRLPVARQAGPVEVITFDAQAEFTAFELNELLPATMLVEAATGPRPVDSLLSVEQARLAIVIAAKSLVWAEVQPDAIRARSVADAARHQQPRAENAAELARMAVRAERIVAAAKADEDVARAELDVVRAAADKKVETEGKLTTARTALEAARKAIDEPGESFASLRGSMKALESNLETEESRFKPFPATSTGRRSALARWITDLQHPLTARVAVNHIWSRHFGRPLVPTVFDFGRKGTPPTHPQLLDWLAIELMEGGGDQAAGKSAGRSPAWGMKHIHRLIVTSNTYRLSSSSAGAASENLANDPDNRYLWRTNPIRMESQTVRDTLLHLAGELDLTMSGPSIPVSNETSRRRSLYFVHSHNEHQKFLSMFDDANVLECYRRSESIVPQQALALENSPLATEVANTIARRIATPATRDFIRAAFVTVLSVEPSEDEQATVAEALTRLTAAAERANRPDPAAQARVGLIQALLNHNDFVTVR
jgi:hypothetical protein